MVQNVRTRRIHLTGSTWWFALANSRGKQFWCCFELVHSACHATKTTVDMLCSIYNHLCSLKVTWRWRQIEREKESRSTLGTTCLKVRVPNLRWWLFERRPTAIPNLKWKITSKQRRQDKWKEQRGRAGRCRRKCDRYACYWWIDQYDGTMTMTEVPDSSRCVGWTLFSCHLDFVFRSLYAAKSS